MKVYLNEITGMADALVSMYMSKRTWTPELDKEIRDNFCICDSGTHDVEAYLKARNATEMRIRSFIKYAWKHTTMLDFITISATVEGIHRAGQDDWDAHACRFNNRIIRASTRLADFAEGEMSDFYKDKIVPLGVVADSILKLPDKMLINGKEYVRTVNGYILEELENDRDVKRGLYMESIPSNFIFKCNMAQWAHVYRLRNKNGTANPEVKQLAEMLQDEIEHNMPWFDREFLAKVMI